MPKPNQKAKSISPRIEDFSSGVLLRLVQLLARSAAKSHLAQTDGASCPATNAQEESDD